MNKKVKITAISLLVIVILFLLLIPKFTKESENSSQRPGQQQNQTVAVDVFVVKESQLENEIRAIGNIKANEEVEIRSEVSRKIISINFREGSYVGAGQVLFRLNADDLYAKLKRQQVELDLALSKLSRDSMLFDKQLISQEEYEVSQNTIEKLRADMNITEVDLSKTYVRAPFSGVVGLRNVSKGAYVTPANVLTTIQDIGRVKLDFSIPEKYIYNFRTGQKVTFKMDGISGDFSGEVYAFEPQVENNTRTLVIRAIVDNQGKRLLPGTFANVVFKIGGSSNALMVPSQSIVPKLKGQSVYVVKDGKAITIDVELGDRKADLVQIVSGNLLPGDTIITTNILRLRNEALVKVAKTE